MSDGLLERLRSEVRGRSPCEAAACPSWTEFGVWLRANGHAEIGEWLGLALAGLARDEDRPRLLAAADRALGLRDPIVRQMWRGDRAWSLWFGPFMLAYIGTGLELDELFGALGPHGLFLTPERAWTGDAGGLLDALEREVPLLLALSLPGAFGPAYDQLLADLSNRTGELVLTNEQLDYEQRRSARRRRQTELPTSSRAVIACASSRELGPLDSDRVAALEHVAVLGPPEMLARWPTPGHLQPCFAPLPSFADRYEFLATPQPALIRRLRSELDDRPISAAHRCPSWLVYIDWLLERGEELFAEWLRLDLAVREAGGPTFEQLRRLDELGASLGDGPLAPVRAAEAEALAALWAERDAKLVPRSAWLGPFMLAYVDPTIDGRHGADELQALLGRHATFLPRSRVYTQLDRGFVARAMARRGVPVLAPTPSLAAELFGRRFVAMREDEVSGFDEHIRIALPGKLLKQQPDSRWVLNLGPVRGDSKSVAVLCCETVDDVERHAEAWTHLQTFEHVVLLGPAELLALWPHGGEWIEPWAACPS